MAYATIAQVASRCASLPLVAGQFTSTTFVTAQQVQGWLQEAEEALNALLESIGGNPPYTAPGAQSQLGQIILCYAAGQVWSVHDRKQGVSGPGAPGFDLLAEWTAKCEDICENPAKWLERLGEVEPGRFRSGITHGRFNQRDDSTTRVPERLKDYGF